MTNEPMTATGWLEREEQRRREAKAKARPRARAMFEDPRLWAVMSQLSSQATTEAQSRFAHKRDPDPIEVASFAARRAVDLAMGHFLERDEEYLAMRADRDRLAETIILAPPRAVAPGVLFAPSKASEQG